MSETMYNLFNYIEDEIDTRFHSLEIQIDLLLDSLVDSLSAGMGQSILLSKSTINKNDVGIVDFKVFGKIKSFSFVDWTHVDGDTQNFLKLHDSIKPYSSIIPANIESYGVLFFPIVRNGVFYLMYKTEQKNQFLLIHYNQTRVVNIEFPKNKFMPIGYEVDGDNIYCYTSDRIVYVYDSNGNIKNMNFKYHESFANGTSLLNYTGFYFIQSIHFNNDYVIIRTKNSFTVFHKSSLLFSHQMYRLHSSNFYRDEVTFMGDYFLHINEDFCSFDILLINGDFKRVQYGSSLLKNIVDCEKYYKVCRVEKDCIWFCMCPCFPAREDKHLLIKLDF